jgi:hypothetical protein
MTKNTHDAVDTTLINSVMQIEMPPWHMSTIITTIRMVRAHIHGSPPTIQSDLQGKVAQITNKDQFIFARYNHLLPQGI